MLITSPSERKQRQNEKLLQVLTFLKEETYSTQAILQRLLGFKTHTPVSLLLRRAVKDGLIQKYSLDVAGGKISIWGITLDGLSVVLKQDDVFPNRFEPSRLSGWSLQHHMMKQQIRLTLEAKGATEWINGDRKNFLAQFTVKHRPDGLITLPDGQRIAIEAERSLKTKARYQEVMKSHLLARTDKHWFFVYYVLPDEHKKQALMKLFDSITFLTFSGRPMTLEQKHRNIFRFFTLEELKDIT